MVDFRWATILCLGYHLSKHKLTRYAKNVGETWPWPSPLDTPMCQYLAFSIPSGSVACYGDETVYTLNVN